jgi:hypothetical protein
VEIDGRQGDGGAEQNEQVSVSVKEEVKWERGSSVQPRSRR